MHSQQIAAIFLKEQGLREQCLRTGSQSVVVVGSIGRVKTRAAITARWTSCAPSGNARKKRSVSVFLLRSGTLNGEGVSAGCCPLRECPFGLYTQV